MGALGGLILNLFALCFKRLKTKKRTVIRVITLSVFTIVFLLSFILALATPEDREGGDILIPIFSLVTYFLSFGWRLIADVVLLFRNKFEISGGCTVTQEKVKDGLGQNDETLSNPCDCESEAGQDNTERIHEFSKVGVWTGYCNFANRCMPKCPCCRQPSDWYVFKGNINLFSYKCHVCMAEVVITPDPTWSKVKFTKILYSGVAAHTLKPNEQPEKSMALFSKTGRLASYCNFANRCMPVCPFCLEFSDWYSAQFELYRHKCPHCMAEVKVTPDFTVTRIQAAEILDLGLAPHNLALGECDPALLVDDSLK